MDKERFWVKRITYFSVFGLLASFVYGISTMYSESAKLNAYVTTTYGPKLTDADVKSLVADSGTSASQVCVIGTDSWQLKRSEAGGKIGYLVRFRSSLKDDVAYETLKGEVSASIECTLERIAKNNALKESWAETTK